MRRTIADARTVYEESLPGLSDYWAGQYRALLAVRETEAQARAAAYVQARADEVLAARTEALRQLTEARDGYDDLAREAKAGRIGAQEAARALEELAARQAQAEDQLGLLAVKAEGLEVIEDEPLAWADEQARRVPATMSDWPW